ncbi:NUDIX domain-containing protein [Micromonospora aurantiaca (nom. illeg.)]|uniref:NUDIX domain-containing protein n=1 Tax=Micromonospora aurantiaca (nom. illeg.) TaxID=47850 RepID=UPI003F49D487
MNDPNGVARMNVASGRDPGESQGDRPMDDLVQFAQKAIIIHDGNLLMVRKSDDHPYHPGCWEIPGGRLRSDECLDEGLRREVHEEVALDVAPARPLAMWMWRPTGVDTIIVVVRQCAIVGEPVAYLTANAVREHISDVQWVPLGEVDGYQINRTAKRPILDALARVTAG